MENYKLKKTQIATLDLESIITSLRTQKNFEHIEFYYSVNPDIKEGLYKASMGIKQYDKWIFKNVLILKPSEVEYGLLYMEQTLFKNIVAYGIDSARTKIKERDGK
jgi:hypothetical protein